MSLRPTESPQHGTALEHWQQRCHLMSPPQAPFQALSKFSESPWKSASMWIPANDLSAMENKNSIIQVTFRLVYDINIILVKDHGSDPEDCRWPEASLLRWSKNPNKTEPYCSLLHTGLREVTCLRETLIWLQSLWEATWMIIADFHEERRWQRRLA